MKMKSKTATALAVVCLSGLMCSSPNNCVRGDTTHCDTAGSHRFQ